MKVEEAIDVLVEIGQFPHCDKLPYAECAKYREYRQKIDGIVELLQLLDDITPALEILYKHRLEAS